jgi:hypothetical protein
MMHSTKMAISSTALTRKHNYMNLKELTDLIAIRNYLVIAVDFRTIDRNTSNELNAIRVSLDSKLLAMLMNKDFKDHIEKQ